ncbi:hypothetical protein BU25DRAFT_407097 [Macroventuria anomochaeta]|uniref:Uncharacterized protein n=1 Tax=Macroventuria anomochaeta TaxID=301207 RepID=A0ACB6SAX7_9PLEO|nr:uncharacterized protein BU25DRAFT_407097 [Macroventuria anomochaeta]KAF2631446.1 hypothetical protein BU25DRAFT_407097 [Macroventuria anomochaeta]
MIGTQQICPASFTCPENDGCSYTDSSRTLTLTCGVDFYGNDSDNQYSESLEACTQACATNTKCAAASFVGGKGAGPCYLKGTKNAASINDNGNVVYIVTASVQSSSIIPSSSATSSPSASAASSNVAISSSVTASASSTTVSSSTFVSSTTTTSSSSATSTSTNLATCDSVNSGTNLVEP